VNEIDPHALFTADWLSLREPADHAAREQQLNDAAAQWLKTRHNGESAERLIVDLGCGRGSNLRYLAPRLPGPQRWRLVDHDADLLDQAGRSCQGQRDAEGQAIVIERVATDLRAPALRYLDYADLVTAAALLDLVDTGWIERLVADCLGQGAALLLALSVDGRIDFIPAAPAQDSGDALAEDGFVLGLLAEHQRRDKGFGGALGTDAPAVLVDKLGHAGFVVDTRPSDWQLGAEHARLAAALIDGWRQAASQQQPAATQRIDAWATRRTADIASGRHSVVVGHQDIFATPPAHHPST